MKRVEITSIEYEGVDMMYGGDRTIHRRNTGATVSGVYFTGRAAFEFSVFMPIEAFTGMTVEQAIIKELNA